MLCQKTRKPLGVAGRLACAKFPLIELGKRRRRRDLIVEEMLVFGLVQFVDIDDAVGVGDKRAPFKIRFMFQLKAEIFLV